MTTTPALDNRRRIIARLDDDGVTPPDIAHRLGISTVAVRRDLAIVRAQNTPTCSVDGCGRPVRRLSAGWCGTHYTRWLKYGDVQADVPIRDRAPRGSQPCTIVDCPRPRYARGWCATHYSRWQAHGDPHGAIDPADPADDVLELVEDIDLDDDGTWQDRAICRGTDPDIWYPEPSDRASVQAAIDTCRTCPVRAHCLHEALDTPPASDFGIWGGTSARQRREIRRARQQATA